MLPPGKNPEVAVTMKDSSCSTSESSMMFMDMQASELGTAFAGKITVVGFKSLKSSTTVYQRKEIVDIN